LRTLILGNQFRSLALFFGDLPAPRFAVLFLFLAELLFVNGALSLLLGVAALNRVPVRVQRAFGQAGLSKQRDCQELVLPI
jgi:hypothetical protein